MRSCAAKMPGVRGHNENTCSAQPRLPLGWGCCSPPAWPGARAPPGQFEREFQREPEPPRVPPEPIIPPGAEERAPPGADQVRFVLKSVQVDGVTVYPATEIQSAYADLLGTEITLARVYDLADALTRKYRNDGFVLSQVVVPQQAIRAGSVRLQAIEAISPASGSRARCSDPGRISTPTLTGSEPRARRGQAPRSRCGGALPAA